MPCKPKTLKLTGGKRGHREASMNGTGEHKVTQCPFPNVTEKKVLHMAKDLPILPCFWLQHTTNCLSWKDKVSMNKEEKKG